MAIAAQYVFEQLHRGRNSEHVHPCTQACTKHRSMNQHTWTYTDGHTQFIQWLGHQIYAPFPGRKTLLSHRHSSLGFHSAIWCLAKASFVTDCVLKRLYDQNLCGPEEFEFLCGKKDCGGVYWVCISVCVRTTVCSAEGPLWVLNLYRWWTHLGTGSHCKTLTEGESKWVSLWMSGGVCACVCSCLRAVRTTGMKPKPYLTFWLSMPPREPLGLGLQTQNKDKMKTENKSFSFTLHFFLYTV